jgi:hypothetical protein
MANPDDCHLTLQRLRRDRTTPQPQTQLQKQPHAPPEVNDLTPRRKVEKPGSLLLFFCLLAGLFQRSHRVTPEPCKDLSTPSLAHHKIPMNTAYDVIVQRIGGGGIWIRLPLVQLTLATLQQSPHVWLHAKQLEQAHEFGGRSGGIARFTSA